MERSLSFPFLSHTLSLPPSPLWITKITTYVVYVQVELYKVQSDLNNVYFFLSMF
jgi:hypothetical protein